MDYRKYIIEMIMAFKQKHTRMHLYTLSTKRLVRIKNDLLESDNVTVECYGEQSQTENEIVKIIIIIIINK